MNFTENSYEGCSKMATIFLMVMSGKKELMPVVSVDKLLEKENSVIKTLSSYIIS